MAWQLDESMVFTSEQLFLYSSPMLLTPFITVERTRPKHSLVEVFHRWLEDLPATIQAEIPAGKGGQRHM